MNRIIQLAVRWKNAIILSLLLVTLAVSSLHNQHRLGESTPTVAIPVAAASRTLSVLEAFKAERDQAHQADLAALEALLSQEGLDDRTREDAAIRIQTLVSNRQAQLAVEGALLESRLAPCVAVIAGGSLTIVTDRQDITEADSALVLAVAAAHTETSPENIKIMTANE